MKFRIKHPLANGFLAAGSEFPSGAAHTGGKFLPQGDGHGIGRGRGVAWVIAINPISKITTSI